MIIEIKEKRIFINHKVNFIARGNLIVDDLLDYYDDVQHFKKVHKLPYKMNVTRFTDIKIVKG